LHRAPPGSRGCGVTDPAQPVQAEGAKVLSGDPEEIPVPSGQVVTLQDVVWNAPGPAGLTLRFGEAAPDAVQFFEAYSLTDGHCTVELF